MSFKKCEFRAISDFLADPLKSNYALITNLDQSSASIDCVLFEKKPKIRPSFERLLEEVRYTIKDGILIMEGNEIVYELFLDDPSLKEIDSNQFVNAEDKIYITIFGNSYLESGWYELKERSPIRFVANNFCIQELM